MVKNKYIQLASCENRIQELEKLQWAKSLEFADSSYREILRQQEGPQAPSSDAPCNDWMECR